MTRVDDDAVVAQKGDCAHERIGRQRVRSLESSLVVEEIERREFGVLRWDAENERRSTPARHLASLLSRSATTGGFDRGIDSTDRLRDRRLRIVVRRIGRLVRTDLEGECPTVVDQLGDDDRGDTVDA